MTTPNVYTINASAPFAEALVRGFITRFGDDPLLLSSAVIYLPTRRAARRFADTFATVLGGAALLPQFKPLGDVEDDEFLLDLSDATLDLPPPVAPLRRKLLMGALIRQWRKSVGDPITYSQAIALSDALSSVLDEFERQDCDLTAIESLAPANLAAYWEHVSAFLVWLRDEWPTILEAEGVMSATRRRNVALAAVAARLKKNPPAYPVIAAGSTGSIPATARLLQVIAGLPCGAVILPGLDRQLDDASWADLDEGHAQFGLRQLLSGLGIDRRAVMDWHEDGGRPSRERLISEALRPPPTTHAWRAIAESGSAEISKGLDGLSLIEAADNAEEARVIALALREVLETPGRMAALVTPDRSLARRVSAEMRRWNVDIDDSAGRPLAHTAAGTFLCLLADSADASFAPVALLALLKHPLASPPEFASSFRGQVRRLDIALRGARPDSGLRGITRAVLRTKDTPFINWWAKVSALLLPFERAIAGDRLDAIILEHAKTAEALAGAEQLWRSESGEAAADLIESFREAASDLPPFESNGYATLFRKLAEDKAVRLTFGRNPRLSILGTQEARLQSFDLVVLGGLNEGTWPPSVGSDPWFSRPMRRDLGLEQPERAIGLSAHDFATLATGSSVLMTRAVKADGAPTVMSRWLQRLIQLTRGLELEHRLASQNNLQAIAQSLITPAAEPRMERPAPRPPVEARPRSLSVTEIEKWIRDPYAIYARHILGLEALDPLDYAAGALERGTAIHKALELFIARYPEGLPADAAVQLAAIAESVFTELEIPKGLLAVWRPRVANAANWFVSVERKRRKTIRKSHLETRGERQFGDFILRGVADRIDVLVEGGAAIVDYKTGTTPSRSQVTALLAPQLPLEGAILSAGGFRNVPLLSPVALQYIQFSGNAKAGMVVDIPDAEELSKKAAEKLADRVAFFDLESTPYPSRLRPYRSDIAGDYDHLARVKEWSLTGWDGGEE